MLAVINKIHWRVGVCVINCTVDRHNCWSHCCSHQSDSHRDFCLPHLHSTPSLGESPSKYCNVWYGKTRMVWLPDGERNLKTRLFVSTEYMNVTDGRTDTARRHRPRSCNSIARQKKSGNWCKVLQHCITRGEKNIYEHPRATAVQKDYSYTHMWQCQCYLLLACTYISINHTCIHIDQVNRQATQFKSVNFKSYKYKYNERFVRRRSYEPSRNAVQQR